MRRETKRTPLPIFSARIGPNKLAVDREIPGRVGYVNAAARAGNTHIAFGAGNFGVAAPHVEIDIAIRAANIDVAVAGVDRERGAHVGDRDVALFVAHGDRRFGGDDDIHIRADALLSPPVGCTSQPSPLLHDFDIRAAGETIRLAIIPCADIFLAVDADLGLVAGADADVSAIAFDRDARVRRNIFRRNVEIDRSGVAHHVGEMFFDAFDTGDDADQREQAKNEKNFAGSDTRSAGIATRGTRGSALIQFQSAPNDQEQRPPVNEKLPSSNPR